MPRRNLSPEQVFELAQGINPFMQLSCFPSGTALGLAVLFFEHVLNIILASLGKLMLLVFHIGKKLIEIPRMKRVDIRPS